MDFKKTRRRTPTVKQAKALQLVTQGMSTRRAMIEAGYSIKTANRGGSLFKFKTVQRTLLNLLKYVQERGMDTSAMGDKLLEWKDASETKILTLAKDKEGKPITKEIVVPDRDTQIKAYDRWKDLVEKAEQPQVDGKVKRRLSIEEFVNGDTTTTIEEDKSAR